MRKSYSKIRHIQEANRILEERLIMEGLESVLNEAVLPIIQEGDDLCDILCRRKQAKFGSNGPVVAEIQSALAKCGFNVEKEGGGINKGCKDNMQLCDGKFRKETEKAVKEFQKSAGLVQDGSVGYKTLTALGSQSASSVGGCIDLPKCDCNEKDNNNDNSDDAKSDWWNLIDGSSKMNDCHTINKCLYKAINGCKGSNDSYCFQNTFFKCMRDGGPKKGGDRECGNCPKYLDFGMGELPQYRECVKKGCSKVAPGIIP